MNQGYSKVFDRFAYGKGTFMSITEDESGKIRHLRKIFINGELCNSKLDFWKKYIEEFDFEAKKDFGKNLDAFNDAIESEGPGFPGECIIEIIGTENLKKIFGKEDFDFIVKLLQEAEFVNLILEKND